MNNCLIRKLEGAITLPNSLKVLAWLLVFGVSLFSLWQSNKSMGMAERSNDLAQQSFVSNQRPWLSVKPARFDTGKFFSLRPVEGGLEERFRFEITNKGNSTAQNIKFTPVNISTTELLPQNPDVVLINSISCQTGTGAIALATGESTTLEIGGKLPFLNKQSVEEVLRKFESGELSIPFNLEITYDSNSPPVQGKTGQSLIFFPNNVVTNYSVLE